MTKLERIEEMEYQIKDLKDELEALKKELDGLWNYVEDLKEL